MQRNLKLRLNNRNGRKDNQARGSSSSSNEDFRFAFAADEALPMEPETMIVTWMSLDTETRREKRELQYDEVLNDGRCWIVVVKRKG